jgi:hypothetical protein
MAVYSIIARYLQDDIGVKWAKRNRFLLNTIIRLVIQVTSYYLRYGIIMARKGNR